jgi:D-sedoheptulose 7-phosphate isomerase
MLNATVGSRLVFTRQVEAPGRPGDLLLAISTPGKSPDVPKELRMARQRGLETARIEEYHGLIIALLREALDPVARKRASG